MKSKIQGKVKTGLVICQAVLLLASVSLLHGCAYTHETRLPGNIKTIYVPTFKDEIPPEKRYTYQPGLEIEVMNAIIDRLIFDGNVKVVEESQADAVLKGSIVSYEQEGLRFDNFESVQEYRLFLVISFELVDRKTGKVLLKEPNFSGRTEFFTSRTPSNVRRSAANNAVTDLARSLVDRIVEEW